MKRELFSRGMRGKSKRKEKEEDSRCEIFPTEDREEKRRRMPPVWKSTGRKRKKPVKKIVLNALPRTSQEIKGGVFFSKAGRKRGHCLTWKGEEKGEKRKKEELVTEGGEDQHSLPPFPQREKEKEKHRLLRLRVRPPLDRKRGERGR